MSSVYRQYQETNNTPNRNTFDWSFQWNGTMEFGKIYPCFFGEMMPDASIQFNKIRQSLHFMPMQFPVQTRMRSYCHFFKVRRRTLWKDFMDWYTNHKDPSGKEYQRPFINFNSEDKLAAMAHTGTIGDYLGLPTVSYGRYSHFEDLHFSGNTAYTGVLAPLPISFTSSSSGALENDMLPTEYIGSTIVLDNAQFTNTAEAVVDNWYGFSIPVTRDMLMDLIDVENRTPFIEFPLNFGGALSLLQANSLRAFVCTDGYTGDTTLQRFVIGSSHTTSVQGVQGDGKVRLNFDNMSFSPDIENKLKEYGDNTTFSIVLGICPTEYIGGQSIPFFQVGPAVPPISYISAPASLFLGNEVQPRELTLETSPWYYIGEPTGKRVKINAEPFRAYEAVYNAFYRNIYNNPYILNGKEEYNKYIPTDAGGADNNTYTLHYRNWEDDFLTTALPNPQQGDNPVLVGITPDANGIGTQMALQDENGKVFNVKFNVSADGEVLESVDLTETGSNSFQVLSYLNLATTGVSIPDIRNANALQRWLELNARKGLRYKDHIKGHFNVDIRFDELNMPEFIGGFAEDVNVDQVTQTVSRAEGAIGSFEDVLGSFAGQAGIFGGSGNEISTFNDEPCYIIGLICVVPMANYSQLLPKYFTNRDVLDEYFPEFANISMQPILMREVAPLQVWEDMQNSSPEDADYVELDSTFGYQRPWYEHLARTDEVHGQFRTHYRDFLINRAFDKAPSLTESFLLVDPNQVNDVFSVRGLGDKILGQIYYDCSVKLPIPRNGQPRIEQ